MIAVHKAGIAQIPLIQNLANIIWPATYSQLVTPHQVDYMMELIYSKSSLQKQIEKGHQFIIAYDDEKAVAFSSYSAGENNASIYKLHKIYILPNQQGKGIGKQLIAYIRKAITPATALQLNVNRNNKALLFYQKLGFKIISEEDIDIGNGFYMNDYVMEMKL